MDRSDTFCPMPWNSVHLRSNGDIRLCCHANVLGPNKGIMRKSDDTAFNAGVDDFVDARNSDLVKDVRVSMLNGEWHPECSRCRTEEESGMMSRRMRENTIWSVDNAVDDTAVDGTIDPEKFPLEFFDIRYGNFCNLKCRMCGPTDSHSWYGDWVKQTNETFFIDAGEKVNLSKNSNDRYVTNHYDWFIDNDRYWENFDKYTKDAKLFYIVGGEPLIIKEHTESLQRLVDSGRAGEMVIEYNTNMTNLPQKMIDLWKNFKRIRCGASIDGFGDVFNYQRYPANWDQVYKHLTTLNNSADLNLVGWFSYTVTTLNIFHLPEFMKWKLEDSGLDRMNTHNPNSPIINYHMCHGPKTLNVKVLPDDKKQLVSDKFAEYKQWITSSDHPENIKSNFASILDAVEKFMWSESYTDRWLDEFIRSTKELDDIRNQDIKTIVPELRDLFE